MSSPNTRDPDNAHRIASLMRRRRQILAENPHLRRQAIADFILSLVMTAQDLDRIGKAGMALGTMPPEGEELAKYLEDIVRSRYRECFGTELGQ